MKKILLAACLLLTFISTFTMSARVYSPSDMPNVQLADRREYVSDPAGLLPDDVKKSVNDVLYQLRLQTSAEVVVAIPPEIGDMTPQQWCEQLFTLWGIGKSDKDNGVLIMISPDDRCGFIMPGYGAEGVLTDIACKRIVDREIRPAMLEENLPVAVEGSVSLVASALSDPAVADELRSSEKDNFGAVSAIDSAVMWKFLRFLAILFFIFAAVVFVLDLVRARRSGSNYERAELWRAHLKVYFWLGVLSLAAGLIFWGLAYLLYRAARNRPLKCPTCGAKMKRLPEDKDNELLNDSQDFEEQLRTVDYDVWECPQCGTVERFPFRADQKKYTECPSCHTVAMCLACDMTLRPATTRSEGEGVKVYECQFCHYRHNKPYRIPKKEDPSSALAAAAIIGSAGRGGGGFGGGSFGGGFGGGATGGGGAGGSW